MYSKKISIYLGLLVLTCLLSMRMRAQQFSYVYIQGDKETPFYVKLEGEMQPRYGKNYCIISQLAPGPINIEILFQQNAYPVQHFTIQVPEAGYRGFLLVRKGSDFSLYDLMKQFYLPAGNKIDDDIVPAPNPASSYVPTKVTSPAIVETVSAPAGNNTETAAINNDNAVVSTPAPPSEQIQTVHAQTTPPPVTQPQFIENVELNNQRTVQAVPASQPAQDTVVVAATPAAEIIAVPSAPIINSDCLQPVSDGEFDILLKKVLQKTDKSRLKYMISKLDNCYSTLQVRMLASTLANDPERYNFLKQAYSRVTDQAKFSTLENLLTTQEWKSYFRLIIP